MSFSLESRPIVTVLNQIKNINKRDGIDLQPSYQRGFIWGAEFMDKLILSIVKGYPIGNFTLRIRSEPNEKGAMQEVVDGQQRLTTIFRFMNNDYIVQGEIAKEIITSISSYLGFEQDQKLDRLKNRLNNKGKILLKFSQLPDTIRANFDAFNISATNITNSSDDEVSEYFRYLQNQERLRAGEIIKSMPDSALERYLDEIDDKENLFRIMSFSNKRRQFDRTFYSVLGLIDGKLQFGGLDRDVLKYAADCDELARKTEECCRVLINQINHISAIGLPHGLIKSNVRLVNYFLLTASLGLVDYTIDTHSKLNALHHINVNLSAFNSAKAGAIDKAFYGYSVEVIEEYRLIALISRGSHAFKRVENRMKILAYYINNFQNKITPSGIIPVD